MYTLVFSKPNNGLHEHCQCCSCTAVLLLLQALAVLHDCEFAHVNLKRNKILCKRLSDGSMHCRITDLGSALREGNDACMPFQACYQTFRPEPCTCKPETLRPETCAVKCSCCSACAHQPADLDCHTFECGLQLLLYMYASAACHD